MLLKIKFVSGFLHNIICNLRLNILSFDNMKKIIRIITQNILYIFDIGIVILFGSNAT